MFVQNKITRIFKGQKPMSTDGLEILKMVTLMTINYIKNIFGVNFSVGINNLIFYVKFNKNKDQLEFKFDPLKTRIRKVFRKIFMKNNSAESSCEMQIIFVTTHL